MTDYINQILNWIIPPLVFIVLGWWLYKIFKPMLSGLGSAIGIQFDKLKGETSREKITNVTYE